MSKRSVFKPRKQSRRTIFIKFLYQDNISPMQYFIYPKRILSGYITDKILVPEICKSGWHFVSTMTCREWWESYNRCYIVIPIGKKVRGLKKDENYDKWSAQQIMFVGQINYRKLQRAYMRIPWSNGAKYKWIHNEAKKVLTKWEKKNGRNGRLYLSKLRKKEQASKRLSVRTV